jgi:hypothetical protein
MGDGCALSSPVIPHPPFHLHLNINHHNNILFLLPGTWATIVALAVMQPWQKKHKNSKKKKKNTYTVFAFRAYFFCKFTANKQCTLKCTKLILEKKY